MITFARQDDGSYRENGELPLGSTVKIDVPDSPSNASPSYTLARALEILRLGPLKHGLYQIIPVDGTAPRSTAPADGTGRRERLRQRRVARNAEPAPIDSYASTQFTPAVETKIQSEEIPMKVKKTREEINARAKAIREAFAEGNVTVAQLTARYQLANSGVTGNLLSGRSCPKAGGPIVKSTRRPKPKAEKAHGPAQPKAERKARKARKTVVAPVVA